MKNSSKTRGLALSVPHPSEVAGALAPSNKPRDRQWRGCHACTRQGRDSTWGCNCVQDVSSVRAVSACLDGCTARGRHTRSIRSQSLPLLGATTIAASPCCLLPFYGAGALQPHQPPTNFPLSTLFFSRIPWTPRRYQVQDRQGRRIGSLSHPPPRKLRRQLKLGGKVSQRTKRFRRRDLAWGRLLSNSFASHSS